MGIWIVVQYACFYTYSGFTDDTLVCLVRPRIVIAIRIEVEFLLAEYILLNVELINMWTEQDQNVTWTYNHILTLAWWCKRYACTTTFHLETNICHLRIRPDWEGL